MEKYVSAWLFFLIYVFTQFYNTKSVFLFAEAEQLQQWGLQIVFICTSDQ
jgi:hypothetical protein